MNTLTASQVGSKKTAPLKGRRLTILAMALNNERGYVYGYELAKMTNILPHNLYPILIALENEGFLASEMMESERGAPRRAYRIKSGVREELQKEVMTQLLQNHGKQRSSDRYSGKLSPA